MEENVKVTEREMFEAIAAAAESGEWTIPMTMVVEFCQKKISQIDHRNEKAKERTAKKKAEPDMLLDAVRNALSTEKFEVISEIAARIEGEDITVNKVINRLSKLVKAGEVEKQEITIKGEEGEKSRRAMTYRKIG